MCNTVTKKYSLTTLNQSSYLTCKPRYLSTSIILSAWSGSMPGSRCQIGRFMYSSILLGSLRHMKYIKKVPSDRDTTTASLWVNPLKFLQECHSALWKKPGVPTFLCTLSSGAEVMVFNWAGSLCQEERWGPKALQHRQHPSTSMPDFGISKQFTPASLHR